MVIADSINLLRSHFQELWSFATSKRFKVYVCELPRHLDVARCASRNVHGWSKGGLEKMKEDFESTPPEMCRLLVEGLLGEKGIEEVEMEEEEEQEGEAKGKKKEGEEAVEVGKAEEEIEQEADGGKGKGKWSDDSDDEEEEDNGKREKKEKRPPPPPGPPTEKKKARSGGGDKRKHSRWESDEEEDSEDEERAKILKERKQDRRQKRKLDEDGGGGGDDARSTTPTTLSHTHTAKSVSWRGVIDDLAMYDERDMVGVIHRDIYKGSEGSSVLELLRRQVSEIMYVSVYVSSRSDGGRGRDEMMIITHTKLIHLTNHAHIRFSPFSYVCMSCLLFSFVMFPLRACGSWGCGLLLLVAFPSFLFLFLQDAQKRKEAEVVAERLAFLQKVHREQQEFKEKKATADEGGAGPGDDDDERRGWG